MRGLISAIAIVGLATSAEAQQYASPIYNGITLRSLNGIVQANGTGPATAVGTTGTGNVVLSTGPAIDLTNATGLPLGGLTGLGTGVQSLLSGTPTGTGGLVGKSNPSISALMVTGSFTATGLVTNADLANSSTNVNGTNCPLGSPCTITAAASSVAVGTTLVTAGTAKNLFYNNAGVLGEVTTGNNGVLVTNGTGVPSISTTLPTGLALQTPASINLSNGTALPATALTGTTLASSVTASSLTSLGTLSALNVSGTSSLGVVNATGAATFSNTANISMRAANPLLTVGLADWTVSLGMPVAQCLFSVSCFMGTNSVSYNQSDGVVAAVQTAPIGGAALAMYGLAFANNASPRGAWSFYGESHRTTVNDYGFVAELAAVNRYNDAQTGDPYSGTFKSVTPLQLDCGDSYASATFNYYGCAMALVIIQNNGSGNTSPFDKGIVFINNAISTTGHPGDAINFANNTGLTWFEASGVRSWQIYSNTDGSVVSGDNFINLKNAAIDFHLAAIDCNLGNSTAFTCTAALAFTPQMIVSNTAADATAGYFVLRKAHGATTAVVNGDTLGTLAWNGYANSGYQSPATISTNVIGSPSGANIPVNMQFSLASASSGLATILTLTQTNATISGTVNITSMANAATTSAVCINTSTGLLTYNGTVGTCTTSSIRFKHDVAPLIESQPDALAAIMAMRPVSFEYNADQNAPGKQVGFIAEDLEKIDARLISYDAKGEPNGIRYLGPMMAYVVSALQELKHDNDNLRAEINRLKRKS